MDRSAEASTGTTFSSLIVEALTRYPEREAFIIGDRRLTYAQAAELTRKWMGVLERRGIGLGSGVALLGPNSPESWLVQAATYLQGGQFSGLQLLASLDDHVFVCDDSGASVLVAASKYVDHAKRIMDNAPGIEHLIVVDPDGHSDAFAEVDQLPALMPGPAGEEDVCWLQYTGGTTGRPKGAMLSHRAMVHGALVVMASLGLPEEPRYLAGGPVSHGSVVPLLPTLLKGGTVVLMPAFEPSEWMRLVDQHRINFALVVPTMLYTLIDNPVPEGCDLSSLKTILYSGAPTSPSRLIEGIQKFGNVFLQAWGQTETLWVTVLRRDEHDPERHPELLSSCGRVVPGAQVAVLDASGSEVPDGEVGEMCVRARSVMLGYRNLPDETGTALAQGWMRTGDMGFRDEQGFFHLVDRKKDMIISGGFNVYAREVEDVVAKHPAVAATAVIAVPDEKWGEAVHAVVVRRPGEQVDAQELRAFVKERKGPVHAPRSVEFVNELPTTAVGKVDKKVLRAAHWGTGERQVH